MQEKIFSIPEGMDIKLERLRKQLEEATVRKHMKKHNIRGKGDQ